MGHEIAGEIVEVGAGVDRLGAGRPGAGDRRDPVRHAARSAARGRMTVCPNQESMGYHYDGGFAEYMVVPAKRARRRRPEPDPRRASASPRPRSPSRWPACSTARSWPASARATTWSVIGAGPIGCLHVRLARARGAARVFLVELNRERLDLAADLVHPDDAVCAEDGDIVDAGPASSPTAAAPTWSSPPPPPAPPRSRRCRWPPGRAGSASSAACPRTSRPSPCDSNLVHYRELTIVGANGSSPAHNARGAASSSPPARCRSPT